MYLELAILAILFFLYSVISGRVERSVITGPIVFVIAGFLLGPMVLGLFSGDVSRSEIRTIADLTLALILFSDAANSNLKTLRQQIQIPARMLLIGLPGVMALGFAAAYLLFDELTIFEAAIIGTMLAATDAALGKAVITDKSVPARLRESLNAESGLNDGMCVPVLFVFIALAEGVGSSGSGTELALKLVAKELGIGIGVGLIVAAGGAWLLKYSASRDWTSKAWVHVMIIALAFAAFAIAQELHGSGYIAAFVGGLMFGHLMRRETHELVQGAEVTGDTLAMITWFAFGTAVVGQQLELFTYEVVLYAVLSLTIIRMLPIYVSLVGSGESVRSRLFLGWFGPRGLASIVFAIILMNSEVPGSDFMALVVSSTVSISLIVHGVSAKPLINWLARGSSHPTN